MNNRIEPHYIIESGGLVLVGEDCKLPLENNKLGIFIDQTSGTLIKHGSASCVSAYADTFRKNMSAFCRDFGTDMVYLEIEAANLTPAALEEINACLSNATRAALLPQRLAQTATA